MTQQASVATHSSYMPDTPEAKMSAIRAGKRSRAVLLVTSGCLCYNCAYLFVLTSDWGFEKIGLYQTQGEQAVNAVYNIVFFTNAASDVILIFSIYFKECTHADSESRNVIGILKMFIAWNAVTIFLCWIAACIQVCYRHSQAQVRYNNSGSVNATVETSGTSALAGNDADTPHLQTQYFWMVLVFITTIAVVRVLVLMCFYVSYLRQLKEQAETTPVLSHELSSNSEADPCDPWRWFQFKRRSSSRSRSRQAPQDGHQSRRSGAEARSLLGWFTPISRRSVAQSIERSIGPERQRVSGRAKSLSRGGVGTGGAVSVPGGVMQPANLYDPAELRDLSSQEDPHVQTGYPLHVVPNRERISYIWHQASAKNVPPEPGSIRPNRLASISSFEAMQLEQLGGVLGRPKLRYFGDTARYEDADDVTSEEPPVADVNRRTVTPAAENPPKPVTEKASPTETSTTTRTRAVPYNYSRRFSLPSDGFETSSGPEQDDKWGRLNLKGKMMSLLSGWHDGVQPESTNCTATPSFHCEAPAVANKPGILEPRRVSFGATVAGGATAPCSIGTTEPEVPAEPQCRPLPAQEVCRSDRTADDAGRLRHDDERLSAGTTSVVTPMNSGSSGAEQCSTTDSQWRKAGRAALPISSTLTQTIQMGWHSGSFVCSPAKVATRDSGQQTDP